MLISEAKNILEIAHDEQDKDVFIDHYEEKLFGLKMFWLRNPVIKQLFIKRLEQAKRYWEALNLIYPGNGIMGINRPEIINFPVNNDKEYFEKYDLNRSEIMLVLSNSMQYGDIEYCVLKLISLQEELEKMLLDRFHWFVSDPEKWKGYFDEQVKVSQPASSEEIKKSLGATYSYERLKGQGDPAFYTCLTEVWRIMKAKQLRSSQP